MNYTGYRGPRVNTVDHLDGVPWYDAPIPGQQHKCRPQTNEWQGVTRRQRCACGAARINGGAWINRNARGAE